jgi:protein-tyrosine phosphatase
MNIEKSFVSLLFVCLGNICRSPIAAALAKKELGKGNKIESAGIFVQAMGASGPAIKVMESEFGINISGHTPRNVSEILLNEFDYIIAMDSYVGNYLINRYDTPLEKTILWEIEDPYSQGIDVYKQCAHEIYSHIKMLIKKCF